MLGPCSSQRRERRKKARSEGEPVKVVLIVRLLGDSQESDYRRRLTAKVTHSALMPRVGSKSRQFHRTVSA